MTLNILLADDSEAIQKVISLSLSHLPVTLTIATNYKKTAEILNRQSIDLVIADAKLAGTSGPADFEALEQSSLGQQLVLLEGTYDQINRADFEACGLIHIIKKPFEASQLIHYIETELGILLRAEKLLQPPGAPSIAAAPSHFTAPIPDQEMQAFITEEINRILPTALASYCQEQFEHIARQMITQELKRLSKERERQAQL